MGRRTAVALVASWLLVSATPADAHMTRYATGLTVVVSYAEDRVDGFLSSEKEACLPERRAKVFLNGTQYGLTQFTEPDGSFTVGAGDIAPEDTVRVEVSKKYVKRSATHAHLCRKTVESV